MLSCGAGGTGWGRARELTREGRAWCSPFHSVCCCVEISGINTDIYIYIYAHAHTHMSIIEEQYRGIPSSPALQSRAVVSELFFTLKLL